MINTLSKLSTYTLLNYNPTVDTSLNWGRLGTSYALLLSAEVLNDRVLKQCAEELWDNLLQEVIPALHDSEPHIDLIRCLLNLQKVGIIDEQYMYFAIQSGIDYLNSYAFNPNFITSQNYDKIISLMLTHSEYLSSQASIEIFALISRFLIRQIETRQIDSMLLSSCKRYIMLSLMLRDEKGCECVVQQLIQLYNLGQITFSTPMVYLIKELQDQLVLNFPTHHLLKENYLDFIVAHNLSLKDFSDIIFHEYITNNGFGQVTLKYTSLEFIMQLFPNSSKDRFSLEHGLARFITIIATCLLHEKRQVNLYSLYL